MKSVFVLGSFAVFSGTALAECGGGGGGGGGFFGGRFFGPARNAPGPSGWSDASDSCGSSGNTRTMVSSSDCGSGTFFTTDDSCSGTNAPPPKARLTIYLSDVPTGATLIAVGKDVSIKGPAPKYRKFVTAPLPYGEYDMSFVLKYPTKDNAIATGTKTVSIWTGEEVMISARDFSYQVAQAPSAPKPVPSTPTPPIPTPAKSPEDGPGAIQIRRPQRSSHLRERQIGQY